MCEVLLASIIVGAFEFAPGSMRIEYFEPAQTGDPQVAFVYTEDYLACLEGRPVAIND